MHACAHIYAYTVTHVCVHIHPHIYEKRPLIVNANQIGKRDFHAGDKLLSAFRHDPHFEVKFPECAPMAKRKNMMESYFFKLFQNVSNFLIAAVQTVLTYFVPCHILFYQPAPIFWGPP